MSTHQVLNKYERARVLIIRAQLLTLGAEPKVETDGSEEPDVIAMMEMEAGVLPLIVTREDGVAIDLSGGE